MTRLACALSCLVASACGGGRPSSAVALPSASVVSLSKPAPALSSNEAASYLADVPGLQDIAPPQVVTCRWKGRDWAEPGGRRRPHEERDDERWTLDFYATPMLGCRMDVLPLRESRLDASLAPHALYLQFESAYAKVHGWTGNALNFRP